MVGIVRLREVCLGWRGRRSWVRVVEAYDVKAPAPRVAQRIEMILRLDEEPCGSSVGDVARRNRLDNLGATANQQTATFFGRGPSSVLDDPLDDRDAQPLHAPVLEVA